MNQSELEHKYHREGAERAAAMIEENEDKGAAYNNPYASTMYRHYVLPLAESIEIAREPAAGRIPVGVKLIEPLESAVVAYIAVRSALSLILSGEDNARTIALRIGSDVYRELTASLFAVADPERFARVDGSLDRRGSKNVRHRSYVLRRAAEEGGMTVPEWQAADKGHVGYWMLIALQDLGMIELETMHDARRGGVKRKMQATLAPEAQARIDSVKTACLSILPIFFPFVEPPRPWVSLRNGGFHTPESQLLLQTCVKIPYSGRAHSTDADTTITREAINTLQNVGWRVNDRLLRVLPQLASKIATKELLATAQLPEPPRPEFLEHVAKEDMTEAQLEEFRVWKREKADWYSANKTRRNRWARYTAARRVAEEFKDYESIYFLHQADSRSRLYAMSGGISPQGSDMQRALLQFDTALPLGGKEGEDWFLVDGANRYGVDKLSLEDRIRWVREHRQAIYDCALDPLNNLMWCDADKPLMWLAWAFEFADYCDDPTNFRSALPVGQDGSCNGLQHYSAMLRDAVGGKATNLLPAATPNDIYAQVGTVLRSRLEALVVTEQAETYRQMWLSHGINRTLCKRSVMTLPYGSTKYSCQDFILDDYLKDGKAPDLDPAVYGALAKFLAPHLWDSIGQVVQSAQTAMEWLQKCSTHILKGKGTDSIQWITPTGFRVVQDYMTVEKVNIKSRLFHRIHIRINNPTRTPDKRRHRNGVAPNFVHSMDASHLALVTLAARAAGIKHLAMIHDDYGTHACNSAKLARIIREEFVRMYETFDPLEQFELMHPGVPRRPEKGTLDLQRVLDSRYFFA